MLEALSVAVLALAHVTPKIQEGAVVAGRAGHDDQPAAARWDQLAMAALDQGPPLLQKGVGQLVDAFVVAQVHGAASASFECANDAAEAGVEARQGSERKMGKCQEHLRLSWGEASVGTG